MLKFGGGLLRGVDLKQNTVMIEVSLLKQQDHFKTRRLQLQLKIQLLVLDRAVSAPAEITIETKTKIEAA
jgi:hypothetical protein